MHTEKSSIKKLLRKELKYGEIDVLTEVDFCDYSFILDICSGTQNYNTESLALMFVAFFCFQYYHSKADSVSILKGDYCLNILGKELRKSNNPKLFQHFIKKLSPPDCYELIDASFVESCILECI